MLKFNDYNKIYEEDVTDLNTSYVKVQYRTSRRKNFIRSI